MLSEGEIPIALSGPADLCCGTETIENPQETLEFPKKNWKLWKTRGSPQWLGVYCFKGARCKVALVPSDHLNLAATVTLVQRCRNHKERNVVGQRPKDQHE